MEFQELVASNGNASLQRNISARFCVEALLGDSWLRTSHLRSLRALTVKDLEILIFGESSSGGQP